MNRDMRQVLADLELLSHGSVQSWNSAGGTDIDGPLMPHGELDPPHIHYRRKYFEADNERHRERVLEEARGVLREWRGHGRQARTDLPTDAQILDARILEAEGWSPGEIAVRLRCTETRVRKVRAAAGLNPADGARTELAAVLMGRESVEGLAARGLSERQIVMFTGVAKTTVRRILRRSA